MQRPLLVLLPLAFLAGLATARLGGQAVQEVPLGGASFVQEVVVPVPPERAFELFTGDVSLYWDHCFSGDPSNLSMDPRPGGLFLEDLGEAGGIVHAEFTFVQRPRTLVMRGPLGFHGKALDFVTSLEFLAEGEDAARVRAEVHMAGELEPGWAEAAQGVWRHFLVERFLPHVEGLER